MSLDFAAMRDAMVESQIRPTAIDDPRVIRAMAEVAREDFVPEEKRALAYADLTLPLGGGRRLNLPMATGRMLNELALGPQDKVLVVGAASGYAAALCARLAETVVAVEEDGDLCAFARTALSAFANVELVEGPLAEGWPGQAPYDAILIDGVVEHVPEAISGQLADGGRLAGGLLDEGVPRLVYGRRQGEGFGTIAFADAQSAPLPGFARPKAFVF